MYKKYSLPKKGTLFAALLFLTPLVNGAPFDPNDFDLKNYSHPVHKTLGEQTEGQSPQDSINFSPSGNPNASILMGQLDEKLQGTFTLGPDNYTPGEDGKPASFHWARIYYKAFEDMPLTNPRESWWGRLMGWLWGQKQASPEAVLDPIQTLAGVISIGKVTTPSKTSAHDICYYVPEDLRLQGIATMMVESFFADMQKRYNVENGHFLSLTLPDEDRCREISASLEGRDSFTLDDLTELGITHKATSVHSLLIRVSLSNPASIIVASKVGTLVDVMHIFKDESTVDYIMPDNTAEEQKVFNTALEFQVNLDGTTPKSKVPDIAKHVQDLSDKGTRGAALQKLKKAALEHSLTRFIV